MARQPRSGVQRLPPINRQTGQQRREQNETCRATPNQAGPDTAGVGKGGKQHGGGNEAGEYDAIGEPVQRHRGKYGREP